MLLAAAALTVQAAQSDVAPRISQQHFKQLHDAGKVIVVDTRSADVYERGHIPGAILLPLEGLEIWPAEYDRVVDSMKSAGKPIVTYCA